MEKTEANKQICPIAEYIKNNSLKGTATVHICKRYSQPKKNEIRLIID